MGIAGHILGPRKLRQLNRMIPGYDFDRAYNRNGVGEARMIDERGECLHFRVDFRTWETQMVEFPIHWYSCPWPIIPLDTLEIPPQNRFAELFTEPPGFMQARVTAAEPITINIVDIVRPKEES